MIIIIISSSLILIQCIAVPVSLLEWCWWWSRQRANDRNKDNLGGQLSNHHLSSSLRWWCWQEMAAVNVGTAAKPHTCLNHQFSDLLRFDRNNWFRICFAFYFYLKLPWTLQIWEISYLRRKSFLFLIHYSAWFHLQPKCHKVGDAAAKHLYNPCKLEWTAHWVWKWENLAPNLLYVKEAF